MSTSSLGTVLDALRAGLIARENLSGVAVYSGPVSLEEAGVECIALGDARLTEVEFAMGGTRQETWDVDGEVYTSAASWDGGTELTIKAARDRTLALFAEAETYINDTYTGALPDVSVTSGEMSPDYTPDGRTCRLMFQLTVKTVINP